VVFFFLSKFVHFSTMHIHFNYFFGRLFTSISTLFITFLYYYFSISISLFLHFKFLCKFCLNSMKIMCQFFFVTFLVALFMNYIKYGQI
jgi:hypothetical protein